MKTKSVLCLLWLLLSPTLGTLWPFSFDHNPYQFHQALKRSWWALFPKMELSEPWILGYKHYKSVDYGKPNRAGNWHHNLAVRVGPSPTPYWLKSGNKRVISKTFEIQKPLLGAHSKQNQWRRN